MAAKPAIYHPYSTNTGQTLLTELVCYPNASVHFIMGPAGAGVPVAAVQLTEEEIPQGMVLLVYSEIDLLVGTSFVPVVQGDGTIQANTILIPANNHYLLQWPSQFFTPVPIADPTEDSNVFINMIFSQNSAGDAYNLENR